MLFHSFEYAVLLVTVFVLYWALARLKLLRLVVLLAASYLFYGWWSRYYLILILASSALDYVVGARLHKSTSTRNRKLLLLASLVGNLGLLGTFKYFNFFLDSFAAAATHLGLSAPAFHLDVVVPVGISFFTFQTISYAVDVYRGNASR